MLKYTLVLALGLCGMLAVSANASMPCPVIEKGWGSVVPEEIGKPAEMVELKGMLRRKVVQFRCPLTPPEFYDKVRGEMKDAVYFCAGGGNQAHWESDSVGGLYQWELAVGDQTYVLDFAANQDLLTRARQRIHTEATVAGKLSAGVVRVTGLE